MTKNNIFFILVTIYMTVTLALVASANDIYITQVGDTLDLDITQDGQNNEFGDIGRHCHTVHRSRTVFFCITYYNL